MKASKTALLAVVLLWAHSIRAEGFRTWVTELEQRQVKVSAGLWDLSSGKLLEGHQTDLALIPASTTKVVSSYAILKTLKPNFAFETEIYGDLQGNVVEGDLVLKGGGDPLLVSERIWLLAQELKKVGVQRITGRLRLDQSAFDGQRYGYGWANTTADTTPPILPLSVNFNRDDRGRIVSDPEALALEVIGTIFRETGIAIENQPGARETRPPARLLTMTSPPLRDLVQSVNKFSNNFTTEMMVKRFGEGSWSRGIQRIQAFYQGALDLGPDKIAITDGSGLSKENRLSARTLAIVLRAAYHDFEVGPEMVASLKIVGGEPWKLSWKDPNLTRRIRCKTGHLTEVTTLCGFLQTLDGQQRVFAILLNGKTRDEDIWKMVSDWAN